LALLGTSYDCLNHRALAGRRPDGKLASHQAQSFLHAHQSQAFRPCGWIKAVASIFNLKPESSGLLRQDHGDLFGLPMLHGII
jgi:hypothetical protein